MHSPPRVETLAKGMPFGKPLTTLDGALGSVVMAESRMVSLYSQ